VEYRGYVLGEWLNEATAGQRSGTPHRWDVLDKSGRVLMTFSDRQHAESYVDHHAGK
jgi:hypothetical protein